MKDNTDILIIGLGPVGLFLTLILAKNGLQVTGVDKNNGSQSESRAIGIHPPLLDLLEDYDLLDKFILSGGIKIECSKVYLNKKSCFDVNFKKIKARNNFVMSIPQASTEAILKSEIQKYSNATLVFNKELNSINQQKSSTSVTFKDKTKLRTNYIVACDGIHSTVRKLLDISWKSSRYPDFYCMADFSESDKAQIEQSHTAFIFLSKQGLLESFPLPNNQRRWVARVGEKEIENIDLKRIVTDRKSSEILLGKQITNGSTFWAYRGVSERFFDSRVLLAGDAAHVVSPIGGQGMNLGWLGAQKISNALLDSIKDPAKTSYLFENYEKEQKNLFNIISQRATSNMSFGRTSSSAILKAKALNFAMKTPLKKTMVEYFTMGKIPTTEVRK